MDHSLLPKTEMVQLVMPNWAMDGPFDSSRPFVTHFDLNLKRKKGTFRYDRSLSDKPEVRKLVTWKASQDSVLSKINSIRRNLIEWVKNQSATHKENLLLN